MIKFNHSGSFAKTERFFRGALRMPIRNILNSYGQKGLVALQQATPVDTGLTAASWSYSVESSRAGYSISWTNDTMAGTVPLVILLHYGHGTGSGGYVAGRDFINPVIGPIFDKIAEDLFAEVTRL